MTASFGRYFIICSYVVVAAVVIANGMKEKYCNRNDVRRQEIDLNQHLVMDYELLRFT